MNLSEAPFLIPNYMYGFYFSKKSVYREKESGPGSNLLCNYLFDMKSASVRKEYPLDMAAKQHGGPA